MIVADAKTGAILANSSIPSYNPNNKDMTSYLDPMVATAYEPGSTMKIFSYMCAIEKGNYDGETKYLSGSKTYTSKNEGDSVTINDWNKKGWGNITYDQGFALSSNIAVANILENNITLEINELPIQRNKEKAKRCDFILRIDKDNIINLELNLKKYSGSTIKNLSYLFHLFSTSTKRKIQ